MNLSKLDLTVASAGVPSGPPTPINERSNGSRPLNAPKWKTKTCPYWIIGKCTLADDQCKYMHIYDLEKLPECQYKYEKDCPKGDDCIYKHIKDDRPECPYYSRGYCKLCRNSLPNVLLMSRNRFERRNGFKVCALAHKKKDLCPDYMVGFCPKGPKCQFLHPKP